MSKRTRTPQPDATLDALKAALDIAATNASHAFSDAVEAAKHTGTIRNKESEAIDRLASLNKRAAETQYAQDADDAHDAEVRLESLRKQKEQAWEKSLAMSEVYMAAQHKENQASLALALHLAQAK